MSTGMNTALITGATGYIGSNLAARLAADNWMLYLVVRPESNLNLLDSSHCDVHVRKHDGSAENLQSIISEAEPEIVFHLAGDASSVNGFVNEEKMIDSNILFGTQLIHAMSLHHVCPIINTETYWQHYQNHEYSPVDFYAATKQAFRDILRYYFETTELRVINLTLFDTYGPNDPRNKFFNYLRKTSASNTSPRFSPGNQLLDLVFIDDVVNAYVVAASRLLSSTDKIWEDYSVNANGRLTLQQIVTKYLSLTGSNQTVDWGGIDYRPRQIMTPWDQYERLPGWSPRISLEEGIHLMEEFENS